MEELDEMFENIREINLFDHANKDVSIDFNEIN